MSHTQRLHDAAAEVLARPPRAPRDPDLFTSGPLFGELGIYPQGSPMAPAAGPPLPDDVVSEELDRLVSARSARPDAAAAAMRRRFSAPALVAAAPDARLRLALVALAGTVGAPVVDAFPSGTTAASLAFGTPESPGRVVGPAKGDPTRRVVNDRYRAEHPVLLAGSLVHDLMWAPEASGHSCETILHALAAMVHVQLVAVLPDLAHRGTELARRQNSLAITLLNSRHPGSRLVSLIAPDGTGTIPGGAPKMQTPDFWSVPFGPPGDSDAPPLLAAVLDGFSDGPVARHQPLRFDAGLARWLDAHSDHRWLPLQDHVRSVVALGLLNPEEIAVAAGTTVAHVIEAFALHDACSHFTNARDCAPRSGPEE